jgi:hypothetical protein
MLFMIIFTWEPEKHNEVMKRRAQWQFSPEIRIIGEWFDLRGHRDFSLIETEDPRVLQGGISEWADLGKFDCVPVMETMELLKLMQKA